MNSFPSFISFRTSIFPGIEGHALLPLVHGERVQEVAREVLSFGEVGEVDIGQVKNKIRKL